MIDRYTLEQITPNKIMLNKDLYKFCWKSAKAIANAYGNTFNWQNFDLYKYVEHHRFILCRRNGVPVGFLMSRLYPSVFDPEVKILCQDLLYSVKGTRAASLLMRDFIDFGKANANHVITMIAEKTNIKPRSLERLGFKKLETFYRIEV